MVTQGQLEHSGLSTKGFPFIHPKNVSKPLYGSGNGQSHGESSDTNTADKLEKSSERSYLDLGTTSKHPRRLKHKKLLKSESLNVRYKTRDRISQILAELGESNAADSMARCGQKIAILTCGEHIVAKTPLWRCNSRLCPMCSSRRASKFVNKYLPYALAFMKLSPVKLTPCLLTLTQKKLPGETAVSARERILKSFHKFIRHSFFSEYFAGGIWANENVASDNENHSHLHIVIFRKKFINADLLKERWAVVSPGAKNLNIKKLDSIENGLRECIKYISKPIPADKLEKRHIAELLQLKGKRMIDTFGEFRQFCRTYELPEPEKPERSVFVAGECCPNPGCQGKPLFEVILSAAGLIDFYRVIESRTQMRC